MKLRLVLTVAGVAALAATAGVAVRVATQSMGAELTAEYAQTGAWDGGLIGRFTVGNPSLRTASDWRLSFSLPEGTTLAGVWNGVLSGTGGTYVITPTAQTRTVAPGRAVTVGLSAVAGSPVAPRRCTINGRACTVEVSMSGIAPAPAGSVERFGPAVPEPATQPAAERLSPSPATAGAAAERGGPGPGGRVGSGPVTGAATTFAPSVNVTNPNRPPLKSLAEASGARMLTLVSALVPAGGGCDLKWGGAAEPRTYAAEVADALGAGITLVASIGATGGTDLAHACPSADALETPVRKLLDLGIRAVDFHLGGGSLGDATANDRLARAVVGLKTRYSGLTVSYTLPAVSGATPVAAEKLAGPLVAARNAGAVVDRVNVAGADVTAPPDVLKPLLRPDAAGAMVDSLLSAATGVHDQFMRIHGLDAAAAWHRLGVVAVVDAGDLAGGSSRLAGAVDRLTAFAREQGLGGVGLLPLTTGQVCVRGLVGQLLAPVVPLLSCVDPAALSGFFAISDRIGRALR
ncbi:cellulose binding domain-containing protein [Planosporangium sp. 12N6]|uniref:cellulose binding domain-containing protein n=1 Tax=Planosporangium spinosum TaxID=3402278 RepID=UPI003CE93F87